MKQCSKCGQAQPLENFYFRKSSKDGYHQQCKKCLLKQVSNNYFANSELAKNRSKKWRKDNSEHKKNVDKNWREKNKDYVLLKNAEWRKDNKEQHRQNAINWSKNNPDKCKESNAKRRQNKTTNGTYAISVKELKKLYSSPCIYCQSTKQISLDHVVPVSRGGSHGIGNIVPACKSCNSSKGSKTITEWKRAKNNPLA